MSARRALVLAALVGCKPDLGTDDSFVDSTRILAVVGEPPETKPGATATYTALVAAGDGTHPSASIGWGWCSAAEPLTENDSVASACLGIQSLEPAGEGNGVRAAMPSDACSLFGPDTPPGGLRPRDADTTGGYYQPLRAELAGSPLTFALARVQCDLAHAAADVARAFALAYVQNQNPHLLPLRGTVDGAAADFDAIPTGARVDLQAGWPAGDAETFAYFDPATQTLGTRRESMEVAWFTNGGALDRESTGRAADDPATTTENGWSAPSRGVAHLWLVLRDSRGGADFADVVVHVTAP